MRRHGVPRRVYYDNGAVYRSHHMKQVVASLGIHKLIFTQPYRPQGHGKIEAFNRLCRAAFIAEIKASSITTLHGLNEAFRAWVDRYYNRRPHGETGREPLARWRAGARAVEIPTEAALREAFLWTATRKADKTGLFGLHGTRYQVGPDLAGQTVEVRYDPERTEQVEVWLDGTFRERVRPFGVTVHRRPRAPEPHEPADAESAPTLDWLGHLVEQRRDGLATPDEALDAALQDRLCQDEGVMDRVAHAVTPETFDLGAVRDFLDRYGPCDPDAFGDVLDAVVEHMGADHHLPTLLEATRAALGGA